MSPKNRSPREPKVLTQVITKVGKMINSEDITKYPENSDSYLADYGFIQGEMGHMLGDILTIIDASVTGSQNKAVKDLIKNIFADEYCKLTEIMFSKERYEEMTTVDNEDVEDFLANVQEVTQDEALGLVNKS